MDIVATWWLDVDNNRDFKKKDFLTVSSFYTIKMGANVYITDTFM
jgi:hypothetical protein